jgi:hypothetical protein
MRIQRHLLKTYGFDILISTLPSSNSVDKIDMGTKFLNMRFRDGQLKVRNALGLGCIP